MDAKKCDRCGKLYARYDAVPDLSLIKYVHPFGDSRIDLCPDCQKMLEDFLNKKEKENGNL